MGLRLRISCLLAAIFILALGLAVAFLLDSARRAVVTELRASTEIASTLINGFGASAVSVDRATVRAALAGLNRQSSLRHLRIATSPPADDRGATDAAVPAWFYRLVRPDPDGLTRTLAASDGELYLVADPAAEIAEAWREVRGTLVLLLLAFFTAMVVVVAALGRLLRPLAELSAALEGIEKGEYSTRLEPSGLADVDRLNERFNQMSAALEVSELNNNALARRSLAIQEDERRHLAHELHDEMGQSITAIKALAVSIQERADPVLAERAGTIMEVSSSIYSRVRQMMTRLHPVVLDELGLVAALEQMVDDWNSYHPGSFCRFVTGERDYGLDDQGRIGVYRVVQEALTNVARHAGAEEVAVTLNRVTNGDGTAAVTVSISDNGCGIDPARDISGLGLRGIRERVKALRGELEISSAAGGGAVVSAVIPLPPAPDKESQA